MGVYTIEVIQRFEVLADDDYKAQQQAVSLAAEDAKRGRLSTMNATVVHKQESAPEAKDFRVRITRWTEREVYVRALLEDDIYNLDEFKLSEMFDDGSYLDEGHEEIDSIEEVGEEDTHYVVRWDLTEKEASNA